MQVSKYVVLSELTTSETAKRKGISNMPTPEHLENLKVTCEAVHTPVREHFGKPIFISSAYRSNALNKAIGGSASSDHCAGKALDLDQDDKGTGVTNKMVFDYIKDNLEFDQLIWEFGSNSNPDWVHVGYRKGQNRKQILRAVRDAKGKTAYLPFK
jgi:hypothetical protein